MKPHLFLFILISSLFSITLVWSQTQINELEIQGHRGARGLLPENSLKGFIKALDLGITTLEMDVVISGDGQVVVSHEPYFNPLICQQKNGEPILEEQPHNMFTMSYDSIQQYDCGSLGNPNFPNQKEMSTFKPLLKNIINTVEQYSKEKKLGKIFYNIEIKSNPKEYEISQPQPNKFVEMVLKLITEMNIADQVSIQSFDVKVLQEVKKQAPTLPTVFLVGNLKGLKKNLKLLGFLPDVYSPYYKLCSKKMLKKAHRKGLKVIVWTVNTKEEILDLMAKGVDGIITDYPNLKKELLQDLE